MSELLIPGYTIKRTLGRGGMATVYLAEQEKFERDIALKVMAPALSADEGFRERFMREAKIVAKISHPNIVAVYDVNELNGIFFIAMEFHPGGDLKARLREGVEVAEALRIARDVARALDFAHGKGYLHRDIKPDNILFRDDGSAVLTDFGIAKATEGDVNLTQMGMVAGTPKYMSPEQARAQALDADSDLYSLGVVLFEMLAGRLPFEASDPIALAILHMNAPVPRFEGRLAHFQPLIDRLLAKQPGQRPQSGAQVIREIDALEKTFDFSAAEPAPSQSETMLRPSLRRPAPVATPVETDAGATVLSPVASPAIPMTASAPVVQAPEPAGATSAPGRSRLAIVIGLAAVLAGGGGWWVLHRADSDSSAGTGAIVVPQQVSSGLEAGAAALARNALVSPPGDNALAHYRGVLAVQPGSPEATAGIRKIVTTLQAQAYAAVEEGRFEAADRLLAQASAIEPGEAGHPALQRAIAAARLATSQKSALRQAPPAPAQVALSRQTPAEAGQPVSAAAPDALARLRIGGMLGSARGALEEGDAATAIQRYEQVLRLDPGNREASEGLRQARAR